MQSTAKVGLLLVVFVGLLVGGFAVLGKSIFANHGDVYYVTLTDAGGVSEGTQVLMAGVSVGSVTQIKLTSPKIAQMRIAIAKGTKIPAGSTVRLPTSLVGFGDSPVTIVPPEKDETAMLAPGATMNGFKGSPLDGILPEGRQTVAELNKTLAAVRKILEDQKLQEKMSTLVATTNKTLDRFGNLANNFSSLLTENRANISRAVTAAVAAIQDVHTVTMKVAELMRDGKLQHNTTALLDRLNSITKHADELVLNMNSLVNDPKLRGPLEKSLSNVAEITTTGKTIASDVATMTKNGTAISENVAVVSKKAIGLTDKAAEIAAKASAIEDQLKGVLDNVGGFLKKTPGTKDIPKISTEIDLMRASQPGYWRTDLTFGVPLKDSKVEFGLYDALNSNKLTLELAKPVTNQLSYRYGIYASSPSVGVEYLLAPRWSLRGDVWDINAARLDLRSSYEFGNGFIGWLGIDRILHDNAFSFGIGMKR